MSNVWVWLVDETTTAYLHYQMLVLRRDLPGRVGGLAAGGSGQLGNTTGSLICNFSCRSPENPYNLNLKVVGITSSPNRTTTKNIKSHYEFRHLIFLSNIDPNILASAIIWFWRFIAEASGIMRDIHRLQLFRND